MNRLPPSIPTNKTPDEIMEGYKQEVIAHFKATWQPFNADFDKAAKKFDHQLREKIAEIYQELRDNGFHAMGFDKHGEIRWGYRVTLDVNREKEEAKFAAAVNIETAEALLKEFIPNLRTKAEREGNASTNF